MKKGEYDAIAQMALEEAHAYEKLLASHERLRMALEECVSNRGIPRSGACFDKARKALKLIPKGE